ncbi:uncharacterized protein SPPG_04773 [Spizellomyces punctatus DAOM BR117]|uniref:G-protein coupled receptors family 3 profile domain-containing protein n=1 Tax=Spizellomyces punctatus (strain DAOM BR117) TaxID=645134 RepID=A0A0L0HHW6_SPIPD|nr:uncharacterized protein SPPG_04773 [Spizellomyces punctatus DAOM BR117]KND00455.1 hypothetical protein SPPG_04773 [Spizellomyces punctatus DAOM BR117]|eukprot:XP_016608494.1 hypothetical protein SPPG_04773 [Spizellomyces punctatus DAOM BR117]
MTSTNATAACFTDPVVLNYIEATAQYAAESYSTAAIITGAALPVVAGNICLSIWRIVWKKRNPRAYVLLLGSLGIAVGAVMLVKPVTHYRGRTRLSVILGLIGSIVSQVALNVAGVLRFSVPLSNRPVRIAYIVITAMFTVSFCAANLVIGLSEIDTWQFPSAISQAFSVKLGILSLILPIFYGISGLVCFSFQLRRFLRSVRHWSMGDDKIYSVEVANHIIMGFLLTMIIIYLSCFHLFDNDARFDSPMSLLFSSALLGCENIFETFTDFIHEVQVTNISSGMRSPALQDELPSPLRGFSLAVPTQRSDAGSSGAD